LNALVCIEFVALSAGAANVFKCQK